MVIEPEIVVIPAGPVRLGLPAFPDTSTLPHRWKEETLVVPAFGIARYSVTVAEYLAFADDSGYAITENLTTDARFENPRSPAAFVSWIDATRYCQWLSRKSGKSYRLVRDAEYEKAARGGADGKRFPWGDEPPQDQADWNNPQGKPNPVGSFPPNAYGLYDMAGSMWSWCEECFEQVVNPSEGRACMCYDDTLLRDVRLNPICRGGSFKTADPTVLQCAYRHEDPSEGRFDCIGFRVALSL